MCTEMQYEQFFAGHLVKSNNIRSVKKKHTSVQNVALQCFSVTFTEKKSTIHYN